MAIAQIQAFVKVPQNVRCRACSASLIDRTYKQPDKLSPAAGASAVVAFSDDDAVQKACKEAANDSVHFVWTQLRALGTFLGVRSQHVKQAANAEAAAKSAQQQPEKVIHPNGTAAIALDLQSTPIQQPQQQQATESSRPQQGASHRQASTSPKPDISAAAQPSSLHAQKHDSTAQTTPPVQQAAAASVNAVARSQPKAVNARPGNGTKAVAKQHHDVECSVEEEVHTHTESREVVEPSNGNSSGQEGAKSTIVHQHSLTTTKKRRRVDEHDAEAVAAAPVAIDKAPAPLTASAPTEGQQGLQNGMCLPLCWPFSVH